MNRGLKPPETPLSHPDTQVVAGVSPMNRGLKRTAEQRAHSHFRYVAGVSPMNRGLKRAALASLALESKATLQEFPR